MRLLIWFNIAVRGKVADRIKNEDKRDEGRRKMGSKATLFFLIFQRRLACSLLIKRNVAM